MTKPSSLLFWFGLVLVASLGLYRTSDRVQDLSRQLVSINSQIETERQNIHVLKAEWVYLTSPQRVEALARRHLALRPTAPKQLITDANLADMLPTRREAMASVSVTGMPIANVRSSLEVPPPRRVAAARRKVTGTRVASNDSGHVVDRITIRRAPVSARQPSLDQIGMLIGQLDMHP